MKPAALLYRRYYEACVVPDGHRYPPDTPELQARWDAMPLWLRVELCRRCGWLDAVWEICPPLGRVLDAVRHSWRRVRGMCPCGECRGGYR
jgi:hypothetical protein